MKDIVDVLREKGCDIDGAMGRMLGDSDFMLRCMRISLTQSEFEQLGEALGRKDAKEAFEYAHALKGVSGNVGLTPVYDAVVKLVEPLRNGNAEGLEDAYRELLEKRAEMKEILDGEDRQ